MNILIRTDGSQDIGSGHVMRCLTLARELRSKDAAVFFACKRLRGGMEEIIREEGFPVFLFDARDMQKDACETGKILERIKKDYHVLPAWLVVDHYSLGQSWQKSMQPFVNKIMVIADLGSQPFCCDLLLDQNLFDDMESHYCSLVDSSCKLLLGPRYALLRPEFREARKNLRKREGRVKRILVFMGGSDPYNLTSVAIGALNQPDFNKIQVDVVVGFSNPHREEVKARCAEQPNMTFYCQINNMAELMARADLAIGARGSATWERCALGLPAITIAIADNQDDGGKNSNLQKAELHLGRREKVDSNMIANALKGLINDSEALLKMGQEAYRIMEGSVCGPDRVAKAMINEINN